MLQSTLTIGGWLVRFFLAIVVVGAVAGFVVSASGEKVYNAIICLWLFAILGLLPWAVTLEVTKALTAYDTEYKVTISDDVSMNEFMEKYKIIDQDGKIYTIRER